MTWNYRVIKRTYPDGTEIFAIHEVYYNEDGEPKRIDATGSFAALLQHEIDHTNGVLAIQEAVAENALMTREEWIRIGRPE